MFIVSCFIHEEIAISGNGNIIEWHAALMGLVGGLAATSNPHPPHKMFRL